MESLNIELLKARIKKLGGTKPEYLPKSVLYVMSRDCRTADNHALAAAQLHAHLLKLPLVVGFVVYPKAGYRCFEHYEFMLKGLNRLKETLADNNIPFLLRLGSARAEIFQLVRDTEPAALYFDFSPLRGPMALKRSVTRSAPCPVFVVDTHNIVPVWQASDKQEATTRTLRFKIESMLAKYMVEPPRLNRHKFSLKNLPGSLSPDSVLKIVKDDIESNGVKLTQQPGEISARHRLTNFLLERFEYYAENRGDPNEVFATTLGPYLHFGQIASLRVALEARAYSDAHPHLKPAYEELLEMLVYAKELCDNFCFYNKSYDRMGGASHWAKATLSKHSGDKRTHIYSIEELDAAGTHDRVWNAAQRELMRTGNISGAMREYWAKRIFEWSKDAPEAIKHSVYLNDYYALDGGDPIGYANIMRAIAGIHTRPSERERDVYGTIAPIDLAAFKQFDLDQYIKQNL
jgi:deoxyribodipyrimidine photo-lyase